MEGTKLTSEGALTPITHRICKLLNANFYAICCFRVGFRNCKGVDWVDLKSQNEVPNMRTHSEGALTNKTRRDAMAAVRYFMFTKSCLGYLVLCYSVCTLCHCTRVRGEDAYHTFENVSAVAKSSSSRRWF